MGGVAGAKPRHRPPPNGQLPYFSHFPCLEANTMAYSDFNLEQVEQELGIKLDESQRLFESVLPVQPSDWLRQTLDTFLSMATSVNSEKVRSEFIIAPILGEVKQRSKEPISLFSGKDFNVDSAKGLTGYCDFLLSRSPEQISVRAPVVAIVEAKKEDLITGIAQCIAEMVAAQIFNAKRDRPLANIYGAVTSGTNWRFLRLSGTTAYVDRDEYYVDRVDQILGICLFAVSGAS
jgi:hypothetical protein